jgi:hypothetical protein
MYTPWYKTWWFRALQSICQGSDTLEEQRVSDSFYSKMHWLWVLLFFYGAYLIGSDRFFLLYVFELRPWEHYAFFVLLFFVLGIVSVQSFLRGKDCRAQVATFLALFLVFSGMVDLGFDHLTIVSSVLGVCVAAACVGAMIFWRSIKTLLVWSALHVAGWIIAFRFMDVGFQGEQGMVLYVLLYVSSIFLAITITVSGFVHLLWWRRSNAPPARYVYVIAWFMIVALSGFLAPTFFWESEAPSSGYWALFLYTFAVWVLPATSYAAAALISRRFFVLSWFDECIVRPSILVAIPMSMLGMMVLFFVYWR